MRTTDELLNQLVGITRPQGEAILRALDETADLDGDVCEFGVAQGATSALIASRMNIGGEILHLFDSFKGLPAPTEKDVLLDDIFKLGAMERYAGQMACQRTEVEAKLRDLRGLNLLPWAVVHGGFVEDTLNQPGLPDDVRFAFVDLDLYQPTRLVLDFLAYTVVTGGIVIVHDYGFFSEGVKTAVDEAVAMGGWLMEIVPKEYATLRRV